MKPEYKKLLRELNKGNAVLLEVEHQKNEYYHRFRLVTSKSCEYAYFTDDEFFTSCFLDEENLTPETIVERMENYDSSNRKIIRMLVLK